MTVSVAADKQAASVTKVQITENMPEDYTFEPSEYTIGEGAASVYVKRNDQTVALNYTDSILDIPVREPIALTLSVARRRWARKRSTRALRIDETIASAAERFKDAVTQ